MAKFCIDCGAPLEPDSKFCSSCGAVIDPKEYAVSQPARQPTPQVQPAPQFTPQAQPAPQSTRQAQSAPQSTRQAQPTPQSTPGQKPQKRATNAPAAKKKGKGVLVVALLLVAAIGAVCFFGFRDGGFFRGGEKNGTSDNAVTLDAASLNSMLDYAKRLEEQGNADAAAAVYELIAKNGGADLVNGAREDIPLVDAMDEIDEAVELFSRKGDK